MDNNKVKLLYIGGYARCGSTILSNVLGEIDSFFNAGELMYIWDRIVSRDGICGCGHHVTNCKIWAKVIQPFCDVDRNVDFNKMIQIRNTAWTCKNIPLWMLFPDKEKMLITKLKEYLEALDLLYSSIGHEVPEDVIIDTSKNPAYLYFLSLISGVDLYVVHIVRDSRATAYSWIHKKEGFTNVSNIKSSLQWLNRNFSFFFLMKRFNWKYLRIRYEDFIVNPIKELKPILELFHEDYKSLDFIKEDGIIFGENHCVYGNPDLFKRGKVKLELDERWMAMDAHNKFITTILTWPLILRYGYPLIV
jgi:hypothetical protein